MIALEKKEGVAVLRLSRGVTNAFNLELVTTVSGALHQVREDPEIHGLVLGSEQNKFFSIGFDIPELFKLPRSEFERFYSRFNRLCLDLLTLPKPTIAAITGHAIAGGCVLALCCDRRFIADGRKLIGMNEIKLGVPVPYIADCILRQLVGVHGAREVEESGEFLPPKRAQDMGLVDKVLPVSGVMTMALERCTALAAMPRAAFAMIKRNRVQPVEDQVAANLEERQGYFVECWYAEDTRARLEAAMQKF